MAKTKWIQRPWTISIGSAIIGVIATAIYDFIKEKPVLSTVGSIIKWFINKIIWILNYNLKVWWIITALLFLIFVLYIISKFQKPQAYKPAFYNYRDDRPEKWKWTWKWIWDNSEKHWDIDNLTAHCPHDDTPLIDRCTRYSLEFECPRCNFHPVGSQCDAPYRIECIILDNANRMSRNTSST